MGLTDFSGRPKSGIAAHPVIAIVVDNVDPEEKARIKVKFVTLHEEAQSDWVRQIAPMAGKERGLYALPEVGDEVLVVFLNGDTSTGIIVGQFWNGKDLPPTEAKDGVPGPAKTDTGATWSTDQFTDGTKNLEKNDRRFWKSRSGHLFVFDDSDGAETVQIWDKSHKLSFVFDSKESRIILANTGGDIHIRTKENLFLEAGKDIKWRSGQHITGESTQDTTHKAKANWTVESTMESSLKSGTAFKIEGGTDLTCKGKVNTTIEGGVAFTAKGGATGTLDGGGMAEIKAAIVKLN